MSAKMGRPTDDPKTKQIGVRLTEKCQRILNLYAQQKGVSPAEAVRHGILKLEVDLKNK